MHKSIEQKPEKPDGCPLFPHATGRWAKKIRGKLVYFGKWSDLAGALAKYAREAEDLHAGRTPTPADAAGLTVKDLANRFLTAKQRLVESGELRQRTFRDYHGTCARLIAAFGKTRIVDDLTAADFEGLRAELSKTLGPVALGAEIGRMKCVFKFALDNDLIDRQMRYGQGFKKPSKRLLRQAKSEAGLKMFEADELRAIIAAANPIMRAMVLLGTNCALGQSDIASLPVSALDLDGGWLNYPRPKTFIPRRARLWVETIAAVKTAIAMRPDPADPADDGLAFLTRGGLRWVRLKSNGDEENPKWAALDSISQEFRKITDGLGINGYRNFYCLRRGFETVAGGSKDQVAVDSIMGHVDSSMSGTYRQRIEDQRLVDVAEYVRSWLFPTKSENSSHKA